MRNWIERIPTADGEPRVTLVNGNHGRIVSLVLSGPGFEACLRMNANTMRALRDALNERLEAAELREEA